MGKFSFQTKNCIICLKEAEWFSGHVIRGSRVVTAGWCVEHSDMDLDLRSPKDKKRYYLANKEGCHGGWLKEYGLTRMPY